MNKKMTNFIETTKGFFSKRSPEILTGLGIAGMLTTTVSAVRATPKALTLIEEKKKVLNTDRLTMIETVKTTWKPYVPAAIICGASIACLVGASTVNSRRNAALATAYAISERTLVKYRDKVVETLGEKKEKEIRDRVAQDNVDNKNFSNSQVIISSKGNTLCMDSVSGRYFRSDLDTIKKAVIELNMELVHQNYISLNEFYYKIGLEPIKNGSYLGWNIDNGYVELEYNACMADNDEPCIVIDYTVAPRYEFDKLM